MTSAAFLSWPRNRDSTKEIHGFAATLRYPTMAIVART